MDKQDSQLDEIGTGAFRRWRFTMQAMFNADAANAMLHELLAEYKSLEFADCASTLNEKWMELPDVTSKEQDEDITDLCLRVVLGPVLVRFGFTPNEQGITNMRSAIISLAKTNKEVNQMQIELQRQLYSHFTNIGCNNQR